MSDYKRLTIRHPHSDYIGITETKQLPDSEQSRKVLARLAELEDKIENGTLIDCPYKLGTELHFIVFNVQSGEHEIFTTQFWLYVSLYKDEFGGIELRLEINDVDFDNDTWIEVCHFLTKAEAEAKLEELKGKQNNATETAYERYLKRVAGGTTND